MTHCCSADPVLHPSHKHRSTQPHIALLTLTSRLFCCPSDLPLCSLQVKHNRLARQRAVHLKASTPSRTEPLYGTRDPGSPGMPNATLDLSRQLANISNIHELSTLV